MKAVNMLVNGKHITIDSVVRNSQELPDSIKDLKKEIENIEIMIRDLLNDKLFNLSSNPFKELVSNGTRISAEKKIELHLKKFPGDGLENFETFRQKLNFLTLGEYKALIVAGSSWHQFEPIFKSKGNLDFRFNQLFTMRNQIAHNNELNDIMIKDGEAAIIWFKSVLQKAYLK